jgi:dimethylamine monooxygenase subunit A
LDVSARPEILQARLPVVPWMTDHGLRLPGTGPIPLGEWLLRDDAFAAQMAYRDRLIAERPEAVHAVTDGCRPAAEELLGLVLGALGEGYGREGGAVTRPDGVVVPLGGPPLLVAGRLVQEDFCVLEKPAGGEEHVLTGAVLCFPSNWTLAQKLGRPLSRIHLPIASYDETVARRVQRLFDGLRPEVPLMRANLLAYSEPDLFNPRAEFHRHTPAGPDRYVRVERQVLRRLPATGAVVFSIHTWMVRPEALTPVQRARVDAVRPGALAAGLSTDR